MQLSLIIEQHILYIGGINRKCVEPGELDAQIRNDQSFFFLFQTGKNEL